MPIKSLVISMLVMACGTAPSAEDKAIYDQHVILGLRVAEVKANTTAHELVLCPTSNEYTEEYLNNNCQLALSSRSGKRVVFTQQPEFASQAGQRERVLVVATPVITGVLAWLAALRRYYNLTEAEQQTMRQWLKPRTVATTFGLLALGTLAFTMVFEPHTAGAAKRATARHFAEIFTTDKDFQAATEVRNVKKILLALAQELELQATPAALRMLQE